MEKLEIRAVIKYQFLKGLKPQEIIDDFQKTLGESAPSDATVYNWYNEFKRGRTSTATIPSPGRPIEVTTQENIQKIHRMVLNDRKLKVREIAEAMNMSSERVYNILHEHLHMKKLLARWVPRVLTAEQKENRVIASELGLKMFERNPTDFLSRLVTMDETWIHHYTPESKQQASYWVGPRESRAKRALTQQTAGKVLASVFWDADGIIFVDYLEHGRTITADYYIGLMDRLDAVLREKRKRTQRKNILFLHDNAPAHKAHKSMTKLEQLGYELVLYPPYSPDLAPSDYYLFPNMKRMLQGKRFYSNEDVEAQTTAYFEELPKSYYKTGIEMLQKRWTKCIELKGDYVEE